jgi:hypothetical protein
MPSNDRSVPYNSGQQNRRLIGAPGAGQFTSTTHGEAGISLGAVAAAITGPAYIRIPKQVFAAVRSLVSSTIRKVRGRSMEPQRSGRIRPYSTKAKLAVAGLVLATAAGAGVAAADGGSVHVCQAAPASVAATATTAAFTPMPAPVIPHVGPTSTGHGKDTIQWLHPGESCPAPAATASGA